MAGSRFRRGVSGHGILGRSSPHLAGIATRRSRSLLGSFLVCAALSGAAYAEPLGTISILSINCGGKTNATLAVGDVVTISHSYNIGGEFLACIRNDSFACVSNSSTSVYTSGTPITRSFTLTGPFPNPAKLSVGDSLSAALQCPAAPPPTQTNTPTDPTQQVTTTFLDNRANQLLSNDPGNTSLSQRDDGSGGTSATPVRA